MAISSRRRIRRLNWRRLNSGRSRLRRVRLATRSVDSNGVTVAPVDLVIANATTNNVAVLLGNNDGTFTEAPGSPYAAGTNPSSVVVADLNGDGNLDFAVTNKGDNSISFFKGDGTGKFTAFPASPFTLQNNSTNSEKAPVALATANFKNTTLPNSTAPEVDLAIVNENSNNVAILLGSLDTAGNVTFIEATSSPIAVGTTPVAIAAGDLNTDGIPDLAVVNQADSTISIILGSTNADATFSFAPGSAAFRGHDAGGDHNRKFHGRRSAEPGCHECGSEHAGSVRRPRWR